VLNIAADAPDQTVKDAWRSALSEAHPDRAMARGLPAEFIEVAHVKSAAINAAYDTIIRDRKAWVLQAAD
jgi:DnaJ like chaperone protein